MFLPTIMARRLVIMFPTSKPTMRMAIKLLLNTRTMWLVIMILTTPNTRENVRICRKVLKSPEKKGDTDLVMPLLRILEDSQSWRS